MEDGGGGDLRAGVGDCSVCGGCFDGQPVSGGVVVDGALAVQRVARDVEAGGAGAVASVAEAGGDGGVRGDGDGFFAAAGAVGEEGGFAAWGDEASGGGSGSTGEGYVGIVLWPPVAKKKVEVVAPRPDSAMFVAGRSRPIEIPFDGAYWYFKAPDRRPSPKAHVAHGLPAELNIRSSDRSPLLMEAHQRLGTRIDLDCCGEIDLAVTNGDNRLGKIAVGMILTDSSSPARASVYLGEKALVSSESTQIALTRAPVEETVRFAIPNVKAGKVRSFDEITVFFMPDRVRALAGAKVNVRSFRLVPR
jgi:hypothetical protein